MTTRKGVTSKIKCPVLRTNIDKLNVKVHALDLGLEFGNPDILNLQTIEQTIEEKFLGEEEFSGLGIYSSFGNHLSSKYKIPEDRMQHAIMFLELHAFVYVAHYSSQFLKPDLEVFDDYLGKINKQAVKLENLISDEMDTILILLKLSQVSEDMPRDYEKTITDVMSSLSSLCKIRSEFKDTLLVKRSQLGVKSPIIHDGLFEWVSNMVWFWTQALERTIVNKYDGMNGRKHLLDFICECIEPLNPSLEYETLDNMLRKVQRTSAEAMNP